MISLQEQHEGIFIEDKYLVEALFTHASIGIIVTNSAGEIILANPFLLSLFGYEETELLKRKVEMLIPPRFHNKHVQHRQNFTDHLQNRPMGAGMDLFGIRKDGSEFPLEVSLCHYTNHKGNCVVAFINDISIRKRSLEEIKRLNDELEEKVEQRTYQLQELLHKLEISKEELARALNKEKELNELKSRFISLASHEFRTPLSTILSSTYLFKKYTTTEEQPKREKHIERIVASVNTLIDILEDFLSVGKIEEGKIALKFQRVDVQALITQIIHEISSIKKTGQTIVHTHTGTQQVMVDPSVMKHIVLNLLSNSIKFSKEHTKIEIKTSVIDNQFQLEVKDQGIGIPKEDQVHLFERFYRCSNASNIQGTGLGLHIISKYVELLNGTMKCESEVGKGTRMVVSINLSSVSSAE